MSQCKEKTTFMLNDLQAADDMSLCTETESLMVTLRHEARAIRKDRELSFLRADKILP